MYAQVAGWPTTELKDVLEQRRHDPLTPYNKGAWAEQLVNLGLCYVWTSLIRRYIGLHRFFSHLPTPKPKYNTISRLVRV